MFIRCAQVDRHGQFHGGNFQDAYYLVLDAVDSQVGGGFLTGFKVGEVALLFCVKLEVTLVEPPAVRDIAAPAFVL